MARARRSARVLAGVVGAIASGLVLQTCGSRTDLGTTDAAGCDGAGAPGASGAPGADSDAASGGVSDAAPNVVADALIDSPVDVVAEAEVDAPTDGGAICVSAMSGLVSYWHLEAPVLDVYGRNDGVLDAGSSSVAQVGFGLTFTGGSSVLATIPDSPSLDVTAGVTITSWIDGFALGGRIFDKITAGAKDGYYLDTYGGVLRFGVGTGSASSSTALPTSKWVHVAGVYNGTDLAVYVNGVPSGTVRHSGSIPVNALAVRLGGDNSGGSLFHGTIDELRLYDRGLSAAEIAAVYDATVAELGLMGVWHAENDFSDSLFNTNGQSAGGVSFVSGQVGRAFGLTGAAMSYVEVPDGPALRLTDAITMEAWIKPTALDGRIFDKSTDGGSDGYLLDTRGGKLRMVVGSATLTSTASLRADRWTHVAATFDGATMALYIDGVSSATGATSTAVPISPVALRFGADSHGNHRFSGGLDELRLYARGLTAAEVLARYNEGRCK